jgi:PhnB protein
MSTTKNSTVQLYLFFSGRCEEALEFYKQALGAEVILMMRVKDTPDVSMRQPGMDPEKIMHVTFKVGETIIMASDGCETATPKFEGFAMSISVATEAEADRKFNALSDGGKVTMPLTKTFWSPRFGMLTDRFGVNWMISMMQ